jgi:hypothetical protein
LILLVLMFIVELIIVSQLLNMPIRTKKQVAALVFYIVLSMIVFAVLIALVVYAIVCLSL